MNISTLEQLFKDDEGNIVIAQPPNLSLSIWMGASVAKLFLTEDPLYSVIDAIALIALVIWALQELTTGVNGFRRGLGGVVLCLLILSKIMPLLR